MPDIDRRLLDPTVVTQRPNDIVGHFTREARLAIHV